VLTETLTGSTCGRWSGTATVADSVLVPSPTVASWMLAKGQAAG
jgi:hypothetical protein